MIVANSVNSQRTLSLPKSKMVHAGESHLFLTKLTENAEIYFGATRAIFPKRTAGRMHVKPSILNRSPE